MKRIVLSNNEISLINRLDLLTGVYPVDCIQFAKTRQLIFLVKEEDLGKAIGMNGRNIKKLCEDLGMTVKIFGYSNKVYDFTLKLLSPVIPENIKELEEGGRKKIIISVPSEKMGKVIGKRGNKLEKIRFLLERRFNVKEVNVIQAN